MKPPYKPIVLAFYKTMLAMQFGNDNYYHGYKIHNYHMLVWGAMFAGKYEIAISSAEKYLQKPHQTLDRYIDYMEPYLSDVWHVLIRFGKWSDIIASHFPKNLIVDLLGMVCKALAYSAVRM